MSLPYFPLYPTDFEADTSHLTLEEDGAYNRLLRLMWMTPGCSLPDDKAWLMRRMRVDSETMERVIWPVIDEFMTRKSGRIFSPRLVAEFKKADETSKRRSDAGKRGGRPQATEKPKKEKKAGFVSEKGGLFDTRALPEPEPDSSEDLATLDLRVSQQESSSQFALTLKEEGSARETLFGPQAILDQFASPSAVVSYIAYRKRHKKGGALTETAAKRLAAGLAEILQRGGDPDDALAMAEERGWITVKPDWYFNEKGNGHGVGGRNGANSHHAVGTLVGAFARAASEFGDGAGDQGFGREAGDPGPRELDRR